MTPLADRVPIGLNHRTSLEVHEGLTVPNVAPDFAAFQDMPAVLATAFMVGFVEATCIEALAPHLKDGERTVGTRVDLTHVAATPVGMVVTADVTLTAIDGRTLRFAVRCEDEAGLIGEGVHDRALIDLDRFTEKLEAKRPAGAQVPGRAGNRAGPVDPRPRPV